MRPKGRLRIGVGDSASLVERLSATDYKTHKFEDLADPNYETPTEDLLVIVGAYEVEEKTGTQSDISYGALRKAVELYNQGRDVLLIQRPGSDMPGKISYESALFEFSPKKYVDVSELEEELFSLKSVEKCG